MGPSARRYDWAVSVMAEKQRMKLPIPPQITRTVESRPPLFPWLQIDMDAFWHLCRMRPIHFGGVGYISDDSIEAYLRLYQLDLPRDEREDFIRNIRVLDDEYLKIQGEQRKSEDGKNGAKDVPEEKKIVGQKPPRRR
jgi:hypothetical protein